MEKGRLEAFSDGVIAIIITIMVLELKVPHGHDLDALLPLYPLFLSYLLSFVNVGIYWNNHHHLLHAAKAVTGRIMWANMHLLFWLSLFPFMTGWLGENGGAWPTATYGIVSLLAGVAYHVLETLIVADLGPSSPVAAALKRGVKGKISIAFYVAAIGFAFVHTLASYCLYAAVALMWFIPDRRIEDRLARG
jgi:uncharacterized membrane protein